MKSTKRPSQPRKRTSRPAINPTSSPPPSTERAPEKESGTRDVWGLTERQSKFVDLFLEDGNATRAYMSAGYAPSTVEVAASCASELLRNPKVATYLDHRRREVRAKLQVTTERVLQEVARLAYFDPAKLYDAKGNLKAIDKLDEDTRRAIATIEVDEAGKVVKVRANDKGANLERLMKVLRLFEPVPLGGIWIQPPEGSSGTVEVTAKMKFTPAEAYKRMLAG